MWIGPNPTRGFVDEVSFHALLLFEIEFQQHLPVVLQIHVPVGRLCIQRTTGRCCRNSASERSRPRRLTPSTHPRAVQKTWTIRNRYGYRHAKSCIFLTVSLSNGRRLTGLRALQTCMIQKRGVFYASPRCPANRRSLNRYKVHGTPTNSQKLQSSLKE